MIRTRTLPSGVRVVSEKLDTVHSCAIGLFAQVGSRDEPDQEAGISHFIEHMLFKGTSRLNAQKLADLINYLGGNINAFTSQEMICLHAKTVGGKAARTIDLLGEMLLDSTFPPHEIRRERQVVLEEYKMYEDSPDELSVDMFLKNLWPRHPLGRPVIGRRGTIRRFSREGIGQYWRRALHPQRVLIAISGQFDSRACSRAINKWFGRMEARDKPLPESANGAPATQPRQSYLRRPVEQAHFCLGMSGPDHYSSQRYAFGLMNMILGGGMSSRLFQEVREKRGLAYSIGSFTQLFRDAGYIAVSGGASPESADEVLAITMAEIEKMCQDEPPLRELELVREQILDTMLMSHENTDARMMRMADSILHHGRVIPLDESERALRRVKPCDVLEVAQKYLADGPIAMASIGPSEGRLPLRARRR